MPKPKTTHRFLSVDDAATYLTISRRAMYAAINRGEVRARRLPGGQRLIVDLDELNDALVVVGPDADDAA